jgi:hypothetical protein
MRWKIFDGSFNADILTDFTKRLVRDAVRNVDLILDNLRGHHRKPVKAWPAAHKHHIEVFNLPGCSPELSRDQMANADLQQAVANLAPARSKLQRVKAAARHLRSAHRQPERSLKSLLTSPPSGAADAAGGAAATRYASHSWARSWRRTARRDRPPSRGRQPLVGIDAQAQEGVARIAQHACHGHRYLDLHGRRRPQRMLCRRLHLPAPLVPFEACRMLLHAGRRSRQLSSRVQPVARCRPVLRSLDQRVPGAAATAGPGGSAERLRVNAAGAA